jgi:hypothetical protein
MLEEEEFEEPEEEEAPEEEPEEEPEDGEEFVRRGRENDEEPEGEKWMEGEEFVRRFFIEFCEYSVIEGDELDTETSCSLPSSCESSILNDKKLEEKEGERSD